MTDPCNYGSEIKQTRDKVDSIYDAVVGTPKYVGIVPRLENLERAHKRISAMMGWVLSASGTAFLGAFFLWIFKIRL
jgi:hypothetical protein